MTERLGEIVVSTRELRLTMPVRPQPSAGRRLRMVCNVVLIAVALVVLFHAATSAGSPASVATRGWSMSPAGFSGGTTVTQAPGSLLYVSGPNLTNRSPFAATIVSVVPHLVGTGLVYVDTRTYDVGMTGWVSWSPGGQGPEPVMAPNTELVGMVLEPNTEPPPNRMMRFLVIDRSPTTIDGVDVTYREAGRLWTQRMGTCFTYGDDEVPASATC